MQASSPAEGTGDDGPACSAAAGPANGVAGSATAGCAGAHSPAANAAAVGAANNAATGSQPKGIGTAPNGSERSLEQQQNLQAAVEASGCGKTAIVEHFREAARKVKRQGEMHVKLREALPLRTALSRPMCAER